MTKLFVVIFAIVLATVAAKDCEWNDVKIPEGGEHSPIGECIRVFCNDGKAAALPCPLYGMPHGCNVKYQKLDLTKPYPGCCAKPYCAPEGEE